MKKVQKRFASGNENSQQFREKPGNTMTAADWVM